MKIFTLASSSSGNCAVVSYGNTRVLIDAGISLRRIRDGLRRADLTPGDIDAILVTHAHTDHISGLRMIIKYHKTPVYSTIGAGYGICQTFPEAEPFLNCFEAGVEFDLGDFAVRSFKTPHDAPGSVGYTLSAGGRKIAYATDLGHVSNEVMEAALGADAAVIEANHDRDMLNSGPHPYFVKERILSERGHLANCDSGSFAARLADSGSRCILLAHLSRDNNTPNLALSAVGHALQGNGLPAVGDIELCVAPPDTMSRVFVL